MSALDWLRKGFGYMLMSMGVSAPAARPNPPAKPAAGAAEKPPPKSGGQ